MAAKEAAAADEPSCHSLSGFSQPQFQSSGQRFPPPARHWIAQVTGGLEEIYTKIQSGWEHVEEDYSKCINDEKFFHPHSKVGLLAGRYQVVRVLGRGNSSTIVQAQDTFRPGLHQVAIKILKPEYYALGYQESQLLRELNKADIHNFSGTVKLLNTFTLGKSFFCMTFELLQPWPLYQMFKKVSDKPQKLSMIRKVAVRMLQILGFLGQQNIIHADLKPENILCASENLSDGIKVIDFGNAIHCVYEELSLYYDEFELQTLLYRAPEVVLGLPFGQEIDMWSLGCILAEFYMGKPLFWTKQKSDLLTQMTSLFGPLPAKVYQRAKFFSLYKDTLGQPASFMDTYSKLGSKLGCMDFKFISFIQGMLSLDPSERLTVAQAIQHPFLAPEMAIKFVLPTKSNGAEASSLYSPVDITPAMYTFTPTGTSDARNKHQTSLELLRHGTTSGTSTQKAVHVVAPFAPIKMKTEGGAKVGQKSEVEVEGTTQGRVQRGRGATRVQGAPAVMQNRPLVNRGAPVKKEEPFLGHQGTSGGARGEIFGGPSVPSLGMNIPSVREGVPHKPEPRVSDFTNRTMHKTKEDCPDDASRPGPSQEQRKDSSHSGNLKSFLRAHRSTVKRNPANVTYVCEKESEHIQDESVGVLPVEIPADSMEDPSAPTSQGQKLFKETGKRLPVRGSLGSKSGSVGAIRSPSGSHKKKRMKYEALSFKKQSGKNVKRTRDKYQRKAVDAGQTTQATRSIILETKSSHLLPAQSVDISNVSPQFRYLDHLKEEAITQKNEDLGLNIQKLESSPKLDRKEGSSTSRDERRESNKTKQEWSPVVDSGVSVIDAKRKVINHDRGVALDQKDITLLTLTHERQAANLEEQSARTKPNRSKTTKKVSNVHRPQSLNSTEEGRTAVLDDSTRKPNRTELDVYNFMSSPEKGAAHPESRKRSLQATSNKVKRSRVKPGIDTSHGEKEQSEGSSLKELKSPSVDGSRSMASTSLSALSSSVSPISKGFQPHSRTEQHSEPSPAENTATKKAEDVPSSSPTSSPVPSSPIASSLQRKPGQSSNTDTKDHLPANHSRTSKGHFHTKAGKSNYSAFERQRSQSSSHFQASPSRSSSSANFPSLISQSSSKAVIPPPSPSGAKLGISHSTKSSPADQIKRLFSASSAGHRSSSQHRTLPENKGSSITLTGAVDTDQESSDKEDSDEQDVILLL